MPGVPVHVEALDVLQRRYPAAVRSLYFSSEIAGGRTMRPETQRKHIFDHENGVRLIIAHERLADGRTGIHIAASFHDPTKAARAAADSTKLMDPVEAALKFVYTTWTSIAQSTRSCELIGMSQYQIIHFFIPDVD